MTTEVRVALIGYGLAGAVFHAPTIAATAGLRLATIVTASPERRERARREHPAARVADRVETVFADPSGHDLVVVATPTSTHVPLALAALVAGEAVVVDKPLAPTAEEARRVVGEARRRGLFLSAYHQRRWDSDTRVILRGRGAHGQGAGGGGGAGPRRAGPRAGLAERRSWLIAAGAGGAGPGAAGERVSDK